MKKEPAGTAPDPQAMKDGALRADLCEMVREFCLAHDAKIIDRLLRDYDVTPRKGIGVKHV